MVPSASLHVTNEYGGNVLMSAVHYGHWTDVTKLLLQGLDINAHNHRGDTPLTLAASRDDLAMVEGLVNQGASAAPAGRLKDTALHRAARFRRDAIAKYLLEKQLVPVDATNARGDTPLLEACRYGNVPIAELLLANGAAINHANKKAMTCLLEAADSGHVDVIKSLLIQPKLDVHVKTKYGDGALELSRYTHGAEKIEEALKAAGVEWVHGKDEGSHHGDHDYTHSDSYPHD